MPAAAVNLGHVVLDSPQKFHLGGKVFTAIWNVDGNYRQFTDLSGDIELGADGGKQHRVTALTLNYDRLRVDSAQASVQADAPLTTNLTARLRAAAQPWEASVTLQGPLASPHLRASLRRGDALAAPPLLELQAVLRPFETWPLGTLKLHTQDLDLSQLASGLPHTRIDGDASVSSAAL